MYLPSKLLNIEICCIILELFSNFSEDFLTLSDIFHFGSHTGTKYEIFVNLTFSPNEMPFKQAIEHWNLSHNSQVIATFLKNLFTFPDILNFGGHIGLKYEISPNLIFSPIKIPFKQAIERQNMFYNSWVIATILKICQSFRPFWILAAILLQNTIFL